MKIYVASSWRNFIQPQVVELLRSIGHEVYDFRRPKEDKYGFAWSDIDVHWQSWTAEQHVSALKHPLAEEGFKYDFEAMQWAEACVLVLPCGGSANAEAGWMKGAGKKVYVYQADNQEPELMYKLFDGILTSPPALREQFSEMKGLAEKQLHRKTFHAFPEGPDSDYGCLYSEYVKVTAEQSWPWDEEQINDMKDALKEHYDVRQVQTDEDQLAELAYWQKEAEKNNNPDGGKAIQAGG